MMETDIVYSPTMYYNKLYFIAEKMVLFIHILFWMNILVN